MPMPIFAKVAKRLARSKKPFAVVVKRDDGDCSRYFVLGGVHSQHETAWEAEKAIMMTGYQGFLEVVDSREAIKGGENG